MFTGNFFTRHLLSLGLLLALAITGGCANDKNTLAQADDAHNTLKPAVMTDQQIDQYLQSVGDRIIASAKKMSDAKDGPESHFTDGESNDWMFKGMQFHLVNSDTVNAFTTGGEHMYVYSALFTMCRTEDELAAIMAHEFAHVYCRHVQKGTNTRMWAAGGTAVVGAAAGAAVAGKDNRLTGAGVGAVTGMGLSQYIGNVFTTKDEDEADKYGFKFYTRAGWDPKKFDDFFQAMLAMQQKQGQTESTGPLAAFESDHPPLSERIENTNRRISELPKDATGWRKSPVMSDAQFSQIKARAAQLSKTTPNDKSLAQAQQLLAAFPCCVSNKSQPQQIKARAQIQQELDDAQKQQAAQQAPAPAEKKSTPKDK